MLIRGSKELWTTTLKLALVVELLKANDTIDWRQPYNVTSGRFISLDGYQRSLLTNIIRSKLRIYLREIQRPDITNIAVWY